jgi:hypothetical protein
MTKKQTALKNSGKKCEKNQTVLHAKKASHCTLTKQISKSKYQEIRASELLMAH